MWKSIYNQSIHLKTETYHWNDRKYLISTEICYLYHKDLLKTEDIQNTTEGKLEHKSSKYVYWGELFVLTEVGGAALFGAALQSGAPMLRSRSGSAAPISGRGLKFYRSAFPHFF